MTDPVWTEFSALSDGWVMAAALTNTWSDSTTLTDGWSAMPWGSSPPVAASVTFGGEAATFGGEDVTW